MNVKRCVLAGAVLILLTMVGNYGLQVPEARGGDRCSPGAPMVDEKELGLPVYPGLEYISRGQGGDMSVNNMPTLPTLGGCTFDPYEEVVRFYEQELPDWSRMERFGNQFFFQEDPGEDFNPVSLEAHIRTHITVVAPFQEGRPVQVNYHYQK